MPGSFGFAKYVRLGAPLLLAAWLPAAACTGSITEPGFTPGGDPPGAGGPAGPGGPVGPGGPGGTSGSLEDPVDQACAASQGALNAGLTPARRLTREELNNTLRDLLGATGRPADALAQDEKIGPFFSNAIAPVDET